MIFFLNRESVLSVEKQCELGVLGTSGLAANNHLLLQGQEEEDHISIVAAENRRERQQGAKRNLNPRHRLDDSGCILSECCSKQHPFIFLAQPQKLLLWEQNLYPRYAKFNLHISV